jgi:hypothetical protein
VTTTRRLYLNAPQTRAFDAFTLAMCVVLAWGRGVGKSTFHIMMWFLLVAQWDHVERETVGGAKIKGIRIVVIGPTRKQLVDIFGAHLRAALTTSMNGGGWSELGGKLNKTIWRVEFPGGSWIQFFGMDTADAARGLRCDVISGDEIDDVEISAYDGVSAPWLSETWSLKMQALSGTPRRGRHGLLWRRYDQGRRGIDGIHSFHATYRDAPDIVDQKFVEGQRAILLAAVFAREWECDFDAGEGLVYSMFHPEAHLRDPNPKAVPTETVVGVDWGFEDPGVMLVCHVYGSGKDAVVHVVEEHRAQHQALSYWVAKAKEIQRRFPKAVFFSDPSQPASILECTQAGVRMFPAKNDREDGVNAVADRLVQRAASIICETHRSTGEGLEECKDCRQIRLPPRLLIAARCTDLIREMGLYKRKKGREKDSYTDAIQDGNDHGCDALRYAIFTRFGSPVDQRAVPAGHVA